MYGCNCHIGCLSGSVTRIGGEKHELSGVVTRVGKSLSGDILGITNRLSGYISLICSVGKLEKFWRWDAGEILYWDNNEEIILEDGIDN